MATGNIARRSILTFGLLLVLITVLVPRPVSAKSLRDSYRLPDLPGFAQSVENGDANALRGVYADGLFALPVVQQPSNNAGYVSTAPDTLTQFSLAAQYGNVGLLAHNYLGGREFYLLMPGQPIELIYGDGHIASFMVSSIHRYQATAPTSMNSDFVDLDTNEYLTANQLFSRMYMGPSHVTFQTCITRNGNSSWGRLFVVALPVADTIPVSGID